MPIITLEYHDVVRDGAWDESGFPGRAAATYKLPVDLFRSHASAVHGLAVPVVNDVVQAMRDGGDAPASRRVVWTFDDGGRGYLTYAADVLEERGWRGHVFVATAFIGQPGFLSPAELRALRDRGHVIGTHSRTHPVRMSSLPRTVMAEEWRTSRLELEAILGCRVEVGSVPGGEYSQDVATVAAEQGVALLFTSEPETAIRSAEGCQVLGRYTLRRGDSPAYAARLAGRFPVARQRQWVFWNVKKAAKQLGGKQYHRIRRLLLDD